MLQVSAISIKTLKFGNTNLLVSQPQMGIGSKKMKIKNINNFVYMRTVHQSIKKQKSQKNSKQPQNFAPFHHDFNRPKSSIQNTSSREPRTISTENIDINKKSKQFSKRSITPSLQLQQMKSECLKNYFPKRMPKKNRDIRWHKYYSFLNTINQTMDIHFHPNDAKIYKQTKEKRENMFKLLKQRPKTGQSNITRRRKSIQLQSMLTSQLSPWNAQHIPSKK